MLIQIQKHNCDNHTFTHTYENMHDRFSHTYMKTQTHIHTQVYTHTSTLTHTYKRSCTFTHTCIRKHIQTRTLSQTLPARGQSRQKTLLFTS